MSTEAADGKSLLIRRTLVLELELPLQSVPPVGGQLTVVLKHAYHDTRSDLELLGELRDFVRME